MANIVDALVDRVVTQITDNQAAYFKTMNGSGFVLPILRAVNKGPATLGSLRTRPVVHIIPSRSETIDRYATQIEVIVAYYVVAANTKVLAKTVARGADALVQLLDDKFSTTRVEIGFDYGLTEGTTDAAATITAVVTV